MKKYIILFFYLLVCCNTMFASPSRRLPYYITLSDGTMVKVIKCGDERGHWLETSDGRMIIDTANGKRIASTSEAKEAWTAIRKHIDASKFNRRHTIVPGNVVKSNAKKAPTGSFTPTYPTKGKIKSLIILANFTDVKFQSATARDDFQRMMMENGYAENGGTGSAHDFYYDSSMGQFDPQFEVVGPVELSHNYAYYGENGRDGEDIHASDMIIEACQLADREVDFSEYDFNNDGYIDNVFVFYAGYGEATTSDANTIWPHSFDITEYTDEPVIFDGLRLDHYACTNELTSEGKMDGIGTFVHEYGHVLGLPDLYATNGTYIFTLGKWSVMDEGEYSNDSRTPPTFSAYERYSLGWLNPVELTGAATLHMPDISENVAYRISTSDPDEYFIIENRQQKGWDSYLPGHGMLVWHIDYDDYLWQMNRVNNSSYHQHVDIIEADNILSSGTRSGDSFPGTANVTSFTPETTPAFVDWSGMPVPVTDNTTEAEYFSLSNINESDGTISVDICGGGEEITSFSQLRPQILEATDVTSSSFTAHWDDIEEADSYEMKIGRMELGETRTEILSFDGGVQALPEWWTTTTTATYNNDSYAGTSKPSLRVQNNDDTLTGSHDGIYGISFWFRGVSADSTNTLKVEMLSSDSIWIERVLIGIKDTTLLSSTSNTTLNVSGKGVIASIGNDGTAYKSVRITFNKGKNGSVALDDVEVLYANLELIPQQTIDGITTNSQTVEGLEAETLYAYTITAIKDNERSKESDVAYVTTAGASGINSIVNDSRTTSSFNIAGQRIGNSYHGIIITSDRKKYLKR